MRAREDAEQRAHTAEQLAALGQCEAAITLYQQLLSAMPGFADAWYNLGRLLRRVERPREALEAYRRALLAGVRAPEEVHLNRAVVYADDLQQPQAAEQELRRALELNPRYQPALLNLGNLQEDLGEREAARRTYESVLALEPRSYAALARYAQLFDIDGPGHVLIGQLRSALSDPAAHHADRAALGFALARALDAAGAYPEAFQAAAHANAASRLSASEPVLYDRAAQERFTEEIISAFPCPVSSKPAGIATGPAPIFICGMFRSGSTLAESMLAAHPAVTAGGELPLLPRLVSRRFSPFPAAAAADPRRFEEAAAEYRAGLALRFPTAQWVTDKRPDNFLFIGLIKRLFPGARIIHTTRDPLDTCLSIFFLHLDQRQSYALDLLDTGHYFRQYRRLMAHWQSCYGEDLLEFNYDSLVREPRSQLQRLLAFLRLDWHEGCLDFAAHARSVRTASVWQVRRGLYQHASGRARHYRHELAALERELQGP